MKKLGVLGGLGPMASAYFMRLLVDMTEAATDQEHIEVILHSKPQIPDRTSYILGKSTENPMESMLEVVEDLTSSGVDMIAIPCITAHFFQKELESRGNCPIIHAIEETADYLKMEGINHVGIMATDGTIKSRLFQDILEKQGIACEVPSENCQSMVMHMIYDNVKAGKPLEMRLFHKVSRELFGHGAQVVLLGCTELSMCKRDHEIGPGILDVMEVLARTCVIRCGKLKQEYESLIS